MMENEKRHPEKEAANNQEEGKTPVQPDEPVGDITSSGDTVRRPDHVLATSPEEQTKGNP